MIILNLANNYFHGSIPDSLGNLTLLHTLSMDGNYLSGKIPDTLKDCQVLIFLNLGSNRLSGQIRPWIGEQMQILKVLILSGNSFEGNIPTTLCQLKSLQILDLSNNHLKGAIPRCVFPAMTTDDRERSYIYDPYSTYTDYLPLTWKGLHIISHHRGVLQELRIIDLSSNLLTDGIPTEITKLVGLVALNLSRNRLVGSIPSDIGELKRLEMLDLSGNQLSCAIPPSMVRMYYLSYLNLSYNTLSGEIPPGVQLESFDSSTYEGNTHLCGPSLNKTCPKNNSFEDIRCSQNEGNTEQENDGNNDDEDNTVVLGISPFYISMGIGFFTGFWVFWGSLILFTSWRYAYFRFLSKMYDFIYVTIAVALAKLQRKLHTQ